MCVSGICERVVQNSFLQALQAPQLCINPEGLLLQVYESIVFEPWDRESGNIACLCTHARMCMGMCFTLNLINWHYS